MSEIVPATFDYGDIDTQDASALEQHAEVIEGVTDQVRRVGAEGVIAIGKELQAAQERLAKQKTGTFQKWVKARCGFSQSTAYSYIAVARCFGKRPNFGRFDSSALFLLSADSCPEDATKEALKRAKKGEKITHKIAKDIKAKYVEPEEETAFDYGAKAERVFAWVRHQVEIWPQEDHEALAQILRQLAKEIES